MIQKYANTLPREHRNTPWSTERTAWEDLTVTMMQWMEFMIIIGSISAVILLWMVM